MIIGIDFGNINSFPAYVNGIDERTRRGGVDVFLLPDKQSKTGIPSTFHFKKAKKAGEQDTYSYGLAATLATPRINRRNILKRRLGQTESIDSQTIHYDAAITGMIKHIVDIANEELVKSGYLHCSKISLSYPVVFSLQEKERLKELAEQVVLNNGEKVQVVGMIQEPAAAALEYLSTLPVTQAATDYTVLVYDLGGGTFDAAVVTAHQDENGVILSYEVLDQIGLPRAGNEFTDAMVSLMQKKLLEIDVQIDTKDAPMERFRNEAENLKCALSEPNTTMVEYEDNDGNVIEITRAELEKATESLVAETIAVSKRLFDRCPAKPTMIIMTGGQSQMPVIRTRLQAQFSGIGTENIIFHKPQQAIALGAARFGILNCETKTIESNPSVVLRTGKMLGTPFTRDNKTDRPYVNALIPRNTPIPMDQPVPRYYAPYAPCTKQTIYLYEALNDDPDIFNNDHFTEIAKLTIDFNIDTPAQPQYEVCAYIDQHNQIHFTARDPKGVFKTVSVEVEYSHGKGGKA